MFFVLKGKAGAKYLEFPLNVTMLQMSDLPCLFVWTRILDMLKFPDEIEAEKEQLLSESQVLSAFSSETVLERESSVFDCSSFLDSSQNVFLSATVNSTLHFCAHVNIRKAEMLAKEREICVQKFPQNEITN